MPQQTGRHHHLYNTRRWQRRAKLQLTEYPLCGMCLARKVVTPATWRTTSRHIRVIISSFYWGELQSLCQHCHSSRKKQQETHGYQRDIGADGWPTDPNHPANKPRPQRTSVQGESGEVPRVHRRRSVFVSMGAGGASQKIRARAL